MKTYKPLVLVIIDGFGIPQEKTGSPWETAKMPTFSEIEKFYPFTALQASGIAVGLPWGEEGNSEVGHLTIGAGKIIYNYLPKITVSINDGSFFTNEAFLKAAKHIKNQSTEKESALHLIGLFSSGTVHACDDHLYALLEFAKKQEIKNVYLHLFTDGKDAYNKEGQSSFKKLEEILEKQYPFAKIASVIGRKYAMDRDGNWSKIRKTYDLFIGVGAGNQKFESASDYIGKQYISLTDDSIEPGMLNEESRIKNNDAIIFYNFREDSMRELVHSFVDKNFNKFNRGKKENLFIVTMTEYEKELPVSFAFQSANVENPLAKLISINRMRQLHIAETEKYAHITYFLNGGTEISFENEERVLVQSPNVDSFAKTPEMSAEKIKETLIKNLAQYDFFAVNFANADMVGHTGDLNATTKAIEIIDSCLNEIKNEVLKINGALIITADHGNAEEKIYQTTGQKKTKHSLNPVPFYLITNDFKKQKPKTEEEIKKNYQDIKGTLTDITPTILELIGIKKPIEMTGNSLIDKLI